MTIVVTIDDVLITPIEQWTFNHYSIFVSAVKNGEIILSKRNEKNT